jgi:RNA recognition motif-containing protein
MHVATWLKTVVLCTHTSSEGFFLAKSIIMSKRGRRSQHRKESNNSTLFVSIRGQKLPDYITGQHLRQHFEQFEHAIVSSKVQREKDTMKSKGYAFIKFTSSSAASEAMRTLQGSLLRGKFPLKIKKYVQRNPTTGAACLPDSDSESISDSDSDSSNTTLYVGVFDSKFPNYVNSGHLRKHFSEFEHTIENAMIVRDMQTKQTKGYGFVTFTSHASAEVAMKKLRGSKLHGKFKLFINFKGSKGSTSTTLSPSSSTAPSLSPSRASSTVDLLSCFSDDETELSDGDCKLYVSVNKSKFPNYINSRHLQAHFSEFKEHIKKAIIVRDFQTKRTKGYGFVTFKSHSAAEIATKKLRGSKLDGKFSLFISVKKDDMEQKSSPIEDEKVLEPLRRSTEELLYLRYRFYILPTVASVTLKNSLPAELMLRENVLYLQGTQTAVSSSISQLGTSTLLHNLQTLAFHGTWNPSFIIQLKESILPGINQSDKDVLCILSSQNEQGSNSTSFTIQIYSHNYKILQEAYQKLNVSVEI